MTVAGQKRRIEAGGRRVVVVLDAEGARDLAALGARLGERAPIPNTWTIREAVQYALRQAVRTWDAPSSPHEELRP